MAMTISPVVAPAPRNSAPVAAAAAPVGGASFGTDSYQTAAVAPASGFSVGRMATWGGGLFAALKWVRPALSSPSGWLTLGIAGLGILAGEKLYQFITGK